MADASVTIERTPGTADKMRAYKIMVDEEEVGRIKDGETVTFAVAAGSHELYLKIDWTRSRKLPFDVTAGEEVRFRCGAGGGPATALTRSLFQRTNYVRLERVGGEAPTS